MFCARAPHVCYHVRRRCKGSPDSRHGKDALMLRPLASLLLRSTSLLAAAEIHPIDWVLILTAEGA